MMMPDASSRRTRSRQARAESPTAADSFWIDMRPLRWSAARILTSIRSSAGVRFATMATFRAYPSSLTRTFFVGHGFQLQHGGTPSPQRKSDVTDFGRLYKRPNLGKPEFGWGEGWGEGVQACR